MLVGCGGSSEPGRLVDAQDDRPSCQFFVCFDHTIWKLQPQRVDDRGFCPPPDFNGVVEEGTCEYGCEDIGVSEAIDEMCRPRPRVPFACAPTGTCTATETQSCDATFDCGVGITYGSCECSEGAWDCASACSDGICGPAAMQAAMTGTWLGTVTPEQGPSYSLTLQIDDGGAWYAMAEPGFWNLGGGGTTSAVIIEAQTSAGAYGILRAHVHADMLLLGLRVQGTRLRGIVAQDCETKYELDLQRVAQ